MIYLDNAATSFPKPPQVIEAVSECLKYYSANPGRGSHDLSVKASTKVLQCRQEIAKLFNISNAFNVIFTFNATHGLNIAIKGILKKKDHVISTVIEHNSVLRPLSYLNKNGVNVTFLGTDENGFVNVGDLKKEIRKNTKAIIMNHVSNVIGSIQDIKEIGKIAKENNIIFVLDAAQSAGSIPIDVEENNIDIMAFPGHKGLMGPQGTGGLFIREGIEIEEFMEGGTGSNSNSMDQPQFLPDKFESGTLNTPGIAGLYEGIKFIEENGIENIRKHEKEILKYLLEELCKIQNVKVYGCMDCERIGSVVSINIEGMDSSQVGYCLNKANVAVRTGYHCAPLIHGILGTANSGTVRISPGYFNTFSDIDELLNIIIELSR